MRNLLVSIRNPFPRSKKTPGANNIDITAPNPAAPKATIGGKLLSRPSNRIASQSTSESSTTSSSSSRSVTSSALTSLTRFHPPSMGGNQASPSLDSYSRSVSSKDRDDDAETIRNNNNYNSSTASSSVMSSLPVLSASTQGAGGNGSSNTILTPSSGSSSCHQRLQIAGVARDTSSISSLPGPSLSSSAATSEVLNKTNPKGLVGLQNLGNTWFDGASLPLA